MTLDPAALIEIHQLYSAYNHAVDEGDGDAFAACFLADGSLEGSGSPVNGSGALADFARGVPTMLPGIRHMTSNVHATGEGDTASGRSYLLVLAPAEGRTQIVLTGRYRDSLRRVDGAWRFATRCFLPDG